MTDEDLMTAVRNGDLAKLGPLFERYHAALFDFLSWMTGDRTAAEDRQVDGAAVDRDQLERHVGTFGIEVRSGLAVGDGDLCRSQSCTIGVSQ